MVSPSWVGRGDAWYEPRYYGTSSEPIATIFRSSLIQNTTSSAWDLKWMSVAALFSSPGHSLFVFRASVLDQLYPSVRPE